MQTLANYLMVADDVDATKLSRIRDAAMEAVNTWLVEKGVADPSAESGSFASLGPGGEGTYALRNAASENATLTEIRLEEPSKGGQTFLTTVSIVSEQHKLIVYVHLTVKNALTVIAPVLTDPKC